MTTLALICTGFALAAINFAFRVSKLKHDGKPLFVRDAPPGTYLGGLIAFGGGGGLMIAKEAGAHDSLRPIWLIGGGLAIGLAGVVAWTWLSAYRAAQGD